MDYRGVVEVKVPFSKNDRLYPYKFENYTKLIKKKVNWYLNESENKRVILTDGLQWDFFERIKDKSNSYKVKLLKSFKLVHLEQPDGEIWKWLEEDTTYTELANYIYSFLEKSSEKMDK